MSFHRHKIYLYLSAVRFDHKDIVEILLNNYSNPNIKYENEDTSPLIEGKYFLVLF